MEKDGRPARTRVYTFSSPVYDDEGFHDEDFLSAQPELNLGGFKIVQQGSFLPHSTFSDGDEAEEEYAHIEDERITHGRYTRDSESEDAYDNTRSGHYYPTTEVVNASQLPQSDRSKEDQRGSLRLNAPAAGQPRAFSLEQQRSYSSGSTRVPRVFATSAASRMPRNYITAPTGTRASETQHIAERRAPGSVRQAAGTRSLMLQQHSVKGGATARPHEHRYGSARYHNRSYISSPPSSPLSKEMKPRTRAAVSLRARKHQDRSTVSARRRRHPSTSNNCSNCNDGYTDNSSFSGVPPSPIGRNELQDLFLAEIEQRHRDSATEAMQRVPTAPLSQSPPSSSSSAQRTTSPVVLSPTAAKVSRMTERVEHVQQVALLENERRMRQLNQEKQESRRQRKIKLDQRRKEIELQLRKDEEKVLQEASLRKQRLQQYRDEVDRQRRAKEEAERLLAEERRRKEQEEEEARRKALQQEEERIRRRALEEQEAKKKQEEEQARKAAQEHDKKDTKGSLLAPVTADSSFTNVADLEKMYRSALEQQLKFEEALPSLGKDRQRFFRVGINKRINQLSMDRQKVIDVVQEIRKVCEVGVRESKLAEHYCYQIFAERLLNFAKKNICPSRDGVVRFAFGCAFVAVALMNFFPRLRVVMIKRMMTECPYVIPFYVPRLPSQPEDEYKRAIGYAKSAKGIEPEEAYLEKMGGLIALYGAITQTDLSSLGIENKYGIDKGWRWMARTLNQRPRRQSASVMNSFLRAAGYQLNQLFPRQFAKLMDYLVNVWLAPNRDSINHPSSVSCLETWVTDREYEKLPEGQNFFLRTS